MKKTMIVLIGLAVSLSAFARSETIICKIENSRQRTIRECVLGDIAYKSRGVVGLARIDSCQIALNQLTITADLNAEQDRVAFAVTRSDVRGFVSEFKAMDEPFQLGVHRLDLGDGFSFACGDYLTRHAFKLQKP